MPKHRVKRNGIFYIIPNDELYQRYRNGEAFIDKYGRLIDSQTKRVVKELEQIADERPIVLVQPPKEHPFRDAAREALAGGLRDVINMGVDKLIYDGIPFLWNEKVKPAIVAYKEYVGNGRKTKVEMMIEEAQTQKETANIQIPAKPKAESSARTHMTEDEILEEQRKAVLHYIGLLESLTKLHNAGVIDRDNVLAQLTNPATIKQFNQTISENPNLLEMTQHIKLTGLLGRDLFQSGIFVPIEAKEIEVLATNNKQED